jgi:hypothetical protein
MLLALEFDSFSPLGGTPFYEKAQSIVTSAQNTSDPGWKAYESQRNRYWMVENFLNPANSQLRDFLYMFNRQGLDLMYEKVDNARNSITESLGMLYKMYIAKPDLFAITLILDTKRDELVNIYADSRVSPMDKTNVVNMLKEMDPANSSKYQAILDSK